MGPFFVHRVRTARSRTRSASLQVLKTAVQLILGGGKPEAMVDQTQRAPFSRLAADRAGQASTVGTALLLVITLVGTGLIVALGGAAIDTTQQSADVNRVEHSMTLFDARAGVVALDETDSQASQFGQPDSGGFRVEEDTGRMTIVHRNHTGTGDNETIYDNRLGAVVYENDETTVAYQGGGVWRGRGNTSRLVSPPEFHYRSSTLTLPIIQVHGDDSASGGATALITSSGETRPVYPNSSDDYDVGGETYSNPVENGTIAVTVEGEYYQGWAQYFRTRTDGNVTVDHDDETATVELVAPELVGDFRFPPRDEPVRIRAMEDEHAVDQFSVTVTEGNNFNNMYFSFWMEDKGKEFEMLVHAPDGIGSNPCSGGTFPSGYNLTMEVYYYDSGTSDGHHAWSNDSIPAETGPVRLQCDSNNNEELYIDYTSDQRLDYQSFTTGDSNWYHDREGSIEDPVNVTQHTGDPLDPTDPIETGDNATIDLLVNHYFAIFAPDMDLRYNYGPGNSPRIDPSTSSGLLEYQASGNTKFITYLHVTENGIEVEFR